MARRSTILVADDDASIRMVIGETLERAGFEVAAFATFSSLWPHLDKGEGDVLITDVLMPDADGLEMLPRIRRTRPDLPVIVISAQNTLSTAVRASQEGAFEYLPKPFDINELEDTVKKAIKQSPQIRSGRQPVPDDSPIVGRSPAMQAVYRTMARVMATDLSILIDGESGTGKELVARAIHDMGARREKPFIAVNMAAIPKDLVESELFGHEKGAFTGAMARYAGRFEEADGGTLFLDEIGDMPFEAQTRLLRVLQQGEFRSVGGRSPVRVDVRVIAATNKDLKKLVDDASFREDLYYRLNVVPLSLPPLRERGEDIPHLVERFTEDAVKEGLPEKNFTEEAVSALQEHSWPGNARELRNLIRRLAALYSEKTIDAPLIRKELKSGRKKRPPGHKKSAAEASLAAAVEHHLERYFEAHPGALPPDGLYGRILQEIERPLIIRSLLATRGNQIAAAKLLGLNRNTLRKKITKLKIQVKRLDFS